MSLVLALDAAQRQTGLLVCLSKHDGRILADPYLLRTKPNSGAPWAKWEMGQVSRLVTELDRILSQYPPGSITAAAIEGPSSWGSKHGAIASISFAVAVGTWGAALQDRGIEYEVVTPEEAKVAATGDRNAKKGIVAQRVARRITFDQALLADVPLGYQEHIFDAGAVLLAAMDLPVLRRAWGRGAA